MVYIKTNEQCVKFFTQDNLHYALPFCSSHSNKFSSFNFANFFIFYCFFQYLLEANVNKNAIIAVTQVMSLDVKDYIRIIFFLSEDFNRFLFLNFLEIYFISLPSFVCSLGEWPPLQYPREWLRNKGQNLDKRYSQINRVMSPAIILTNLMNIRQ